MIKLNKIKRNCVAAVILTMCLMTAGCARNSTSTTTASGGETTITSGITKEDTDVTHADDAENYRVSITGDFTVTSDTSDGVTQSGSVYTITKAGEYTVAGLLSEGQLIVDAGDENEVTIVLNGTSVTCSTGSPIYVKNASEVKIKSEENSFNEVIDNRAEPRFWRSVRTLSQKFAPSFLDIYIPSSSLCPSRSIPSTLYIARITAQPRSSVTL